MIIDLTKLETLALIRYYASVIEEIAARGELGDIEALILYTHRLGVLADRPEIKSK